MQPVLLNWGASNLSGWGLVGLNLLFQWANDPDLRPVMGAAIGEHDLLATDPLRIAACRNAILGSNAFQAELARVPKAARLSFPVMVGLGNGLQGPGSVLGRRTIARCIFEDTRLERLDEILAPYDVLLCASQWNAELLKAHCRKPVECVFEGIDPSLFHPGPKSGLLPKDRFYIFSGGKVEYRKGHDLTLLAFREFSRRHSDAMLVTLWHSPWPQLSAGFQGKLAAPLALNARGTIDAPRWLAANGIDPATVIELPQTPNPLMPQILRDMDCALAPSRAEACTNLLAKEAMASGCPVIAGVNTGMTDLLAEDNCVRLTRQTPIRDYALCGTEGWGESDVDEILDALERLYTDTALRKRIGADGAAWIVRQDRTWAAHARGVKTIVLS
jgi:glycosyltransferase involved in cell wall biosynthesis